MAISRRREYLADAGSVELTKNPDAMIRALQKISGNSALPAPVQIRAMFIDFPPGPGFLGFFETHPPIEKRLDALVRFAGGRLAAETVAAIDANDGGPPESGRRTIDAPTTIARPWGETNV
jgi:heat shock protein HtpX